VAHLSRYNDTCPDTKLLSHGDLRDDSVSGTCRAEHLNGFRGNSQAENGDIWGQGPPSGRAT
jgi:hypothetical protein